MEKHCDCVDYCQRSGHSPKRSFAFWTPYIPNEIPGEYPTCKKTLPNHKMQYASLDTEE